jgi:hypothetical protein
MGDPWYSNGEKNEPPPQYWLDFQVCSDGLRTAGSSSSNNGGGGDGASEAKTGHSTPLAHRTRTFPRFTELPAELRLKIWELLIAPRIVVVACVSSANAAQKRAQLTARPRCPAVPALLHVCHESRLLAQRHWELTFSWQVSRSLREDGADADADPDPDAQGVAAQRPSRRRQRPRSATATAAAPARVWFNFALDALLLLGELDPLDAHGFNAPSAYFLRREDTGRVRHVACAFEALRYGAAPDEQIFGCLFGIVDRFPAARRLLITSTDRDLTDYGSVLPALGHGPQQRLASERNIVQRIWDGWLRGRSVVTLALEKRQILMVREDGLAEFLASSG